MSSPKWYFLLFLLYLFVSGCTFGTGKKCDAAGNCVEMTKIEPDKNIVRPLMHTFDCAMIRQNLKRGESLPQKCR